MNGISFISLTGVLACFSQLISGQVEVCMFYNLHADCYYRVDGVRLSHILAEILGNCQVEVCMFYNLHADCYYRVDGVCLSHILAEINQCTDPVEVTFKITCNRPNVNFEHTFSSKEQVVSVPGYGVEVKLHLKMNMKEEDTLNVEADFYVSGREKTDFINDNVKLRGLADHCPILNKAAQIAIGTMGGLVVVAGILILGLVYVRCRRRAKAAQNSSVLIENAEDPGFSTPRNSRIIEEVLTGDQLAAESATPINRSDNDTAVAINRSEGSQDSSINRSEGQQLSNSAEGVGGNTQHEDSERSSETVQNQQENAMRYSEMLQSNNVKQYKISDC